MWQRSELTPEQINAAAPVIDPLTEALSYGDDLVDWGCGWPQTAEAMVYDIGGGQACGTIRLDLVCGQDKCVLRGDLGGGALVGPG